ncbi:DMT family transporter [Leucobacter sp. GX24907]
MPVTKSRFPVWLALLGSGLAGAMVALQSRVNGGLSQAIDNGYLAAIVSFGSGLVVLTVLVFTVRRARNGIKTLAVEVRAGRYPVWGLLGGLCGAFFVLSQGLVATLLGVAMFTVGIVAGQVVGGLVMDRVGLGPGGRVDPTPTRIAGTVLAVVAVAVSVSSDLAGGGRIWLVVVPLLAGAGMAWQSAVNGLVRAASQSAIAATFVNFVVGSAALAILAAGSLVVNGWPEQWPTQPWFYLGGLMGVVFIAIATILVRTAGVLLLSMSNVAGQLVGSVLLERWLPLAGGVTGGLLLGVGIALVAVIVAALRSPSRT